ncbi:MAG: phenylalanine--tRNA ligase subunit alpha, partial [Alphaproteobacteria bacterium]|nr:phenylalanine--tRNA ligase subunit alpha [Alphaproteobacteria bacterium]
MDDPQQVAEAGLGEIAAADSPDALEQVRVKYLGRQGAVTGLMRGLGALPADERRAAGARFNALKDRIAEAIEARGTELNRAALTSRLAAERADATLPAAPAPMGRIHPISQTIDEIVAIFGEMGFAVAEGPH